MPVSTGVPFVGGPVMGAPVGSVLYASPANRVAALPIGGAGMAMFSDGAAPSWGHEFSGTLWVQSGVARVSATCSSSGAVITSSGGTDLANVQVGWAVSGPGVQAGTYVTVKNASNQVTVNQAPTPDLAAATTYFTRGFIQQGSGTGNPVAILSLGMVADKSVLYTVPNALSLTALSIPTLESTNTFQRRITIANATDAVSLYFDLSAGTPTHVIRVYDGANQLASLNSYGVWTENYPNWTDGGSLLVHTTAGVFTDTRTVYWSDASGTPVLWTQTNGQPLAEQLLYGAGANLPMAAFTMGSGIRAFLTTPTKANLSAAVSDDNVAFLGTAQTFTAAQTMAATGAVSFTVQPPVDADTTDILRVYARDTGNLGVMVDYTAGGINVAGIGFWPSANIGVGNVGSFISAALSTGRTWTMPNATGTVTVIASANLVSTRVPFMSGTTGLMATNTNMTFATDTLTITKIAATTFSAGFTMADAQNIALNATTGTKIGTGTTQKLAFHNATPVAQRSGAAQAAVATTGAALSSYGYTTAAQADGIVTLLNELRASLVEKGLIAGA